MFRYARGPAIGKALFMLLQGILPVVILMLIERIINGIISYLNGKQPLWEVAVSVAGMAIRLLLKTASQFVRGCFIGKRNSLKECFFHISMCR